MFNFSLDEQVEDTVTGFRGTITARAEYLNSPNQYLLENLDSTGRPIEYWVIESRIVSIPGFGRSNLTGEYN